MPRGTIGDFGVLYTCIDICEGSVNMNLAMLTHSSDKMHYSDSIGPSSEAQEAPLNLSGVPTDTTRPLPRQLSIQEPKSTLRFDPDIISPASVACCRRSKQIGSVISKLEGLPSCKAQ